MSKAFGLAGLRIGWIATKDDDIRRKMNHFKDYTTICNSGPSEELAKIALKYKEKVLNRNRNIIQRNLALLDKFFDNYSDYFEWRRPKAGSVGFVKVKFTNKAEEFCLKVVKEKGVVLLPGTIYEYGDNYFRVGFGRANMPESLEKFEEYVIENLIEK
ncbi:MAG: aminotransferase class I/II-fold pyridoxal phosphate-dependent enzyme, partial [Promethearchaeota archaeon]